MIHWLSWVRRVLSLWCLKTYGNFFKFNRDSKLYRSLEFEGVLILRFLMRELSCRLPRFKLPNTSRSTLLIYEANKRKVVSYLRWYNIESRTILKPYHKWKRKVIPYEKSYEKKKWGLGCMSRTVQYGVDYVLGLCKCLHGICVCKKKSL